MLEENFRFCGIDTWMRKTSRTALTGIKSVYHTPQLQHYVTSLLFFDLLIKLIKAEVVNCILEVSCFSS